VLLFGEEGAVLLRQQLYLHFILKVHVFFCSPIYCDDDNISYLLYVPPAFISLPFPYVEPSLVNVLSVFLLPLSVTIFLLISSTLLSLPSFLQTPSKILFLYPFLTRLVIFRHR